MVINMVKIYKKLSKFVHMNWKYILIILVLVILVLQHRYSLFFTQEITKDDVKVSDEEAIINSENYYKQIPITAGINGNYYKLDISLRAEAVNTFSSAIDQKGMVSQEQTATQVNISLKSDYSDKRLIKTIKVPFSSKFMQQEIILPVEADDSKIILERADRNDGSIIFSKETALTKLNIDNDAQISKLKPTVIGAVNTDVLGPSLLTDANSVLYTYDYDKTELFGQVFKAENVNLTSVGMKLKVKGKGGLVSFFAELHEATKVGDKFVISPVSLQQSEFHTYEPQTYIDVNGDWKFWMAHELEVGKYYFVGITNRNSESNWLNNLSMIGSKDAEYTDGYAGLVGDDGTLEKKGELSLKVYSTNYVEAQGEKVLDGATFYDQGGYGIYSYGTKQNPNSIFDLLPFDRSLGSIYYEAREGCIVGQAQNNQSFTYKFNMLYPIKKLYVNATDLGNGNFQSKIFYSFDNQNWQEIPPRLGADDESNLNTDTDAPVKYASKIPGNNESKEVYIKVTYDPNSPGAKSVLFGVKGLSIKGEVDTSK